MKSTEGSMTNMRRGVEKRPSRDRKTLLTQLCFSFLLLLFSNFCFSLFASWSGREWFPVCALRGSVELAVLPLGAAQAKIFHCFCGAGGAAPGPAAVGCTAAPAGNARQGLIFCSLHRTVGRSLGSFCRQFWCDLLGCWITYWHLLLN